LKLYISGPMTGLPDYNRPAFHAEAARLRALGFEVENPAEVKLEGGATWLQYMRIDLKMLLDCDAIVMLEGWHRSLGANIERRLAVSLGLKVFNAWELISTEALRELQAG
jgi:hypothetical protein